MIGVADSCPAVPGRKAQLARRELAADVWRLRLQQVLEETYSVLAALSQLFKVSERRHEALEVALARAAPVLNSQNSNLVR